MTLGNLIIGWRIHRCCCLYLVFILSLTVYLCLHIIRVPAYYVCFLPLCEFFKFRIFFFVCITLDWNFVRIMSVSFGVCLFVFALVSLYLCLLVLFVCLSSYVYMSCFSVSLFMYVCLNPPIFPFVCLYLYPSIHPCVRMRVQACRQLPIQQQPSIRHPWRLHHERVSRAPRLGRLRSVK